MARQFSAPPVVPVLPPLIYPAFLPIFPNTPNVPQPSPSRTRSVPSWLFYIYLLKTGLNLKEVKGKLISGKKVILVDDSSENFALIEQILSEIMALVNLERPPKFTQGKFCANCAYSEYGESLFPAEQYR